MDTTDSSSTKLIDDLRRELAQARAERDEALARETATAEVLQVINSSPADLAPVFDAIVEKATALCDAAYGGLRTFDGNVFSLVAMTGGVGFAERSLRESGQDSPMFEPFRRGECLVHHRDVRESTEYRSGEALRARLDFGGVRTWLGIPLKKDDALFGVIVVYRMEVRPFTDKQIALLQNFAAQAVIAIENARLITETREALEQQTATAEVLQVINASPGDLAPVFDAILESALRLCEVSFGFLVTYDGELLRVAASRNLPDKLADYLDSQELRPDPHTLLGRAVLERRTIHTEDNANTEGYRDGVPLVVTTVELAGIRTTLHVPLIRDDRVLGVVIFFRQ